MNYENARKQIEVLTALIEANEAIEAGKIIPIERAPIDAMAQKTTARNVALAGSGSKAELMGTIADEPTIDVRGLEAIGVDTLFAEEIISARDKIRGDALIIDAEISAAAIEAEPIIEDIVPIEIIKVVR